MTAHTWHTVAATAGRMIARLHPEDTSVGFVVSEARKYADSESLPYSLCVTVAEAAKHEQFHRVLDARQRADLAALRAKLTGEVAA